MGGVSRNFHLSGNNLLSEAILAFTSSAASLSLFDKMFEIPVSSVLYYPGS